MGFKYITKEDWDNKSGKGISYPPERLQYRWEIESLDNDLDVIQIRIFDENGNCIAYQKVIRSIKRSIEYSLNLSLAIQNYVCHLMNAIESEIEAKLSGF